MLKNNDFGNRANSVHGAGFRSDRNKKPYDVRSRFFITLPCTGKYDVCVYWRD